MRPQDRSHDSSFVDKILMHSPSARALSCPRPLAIYIQCKNVWVVLTQFRLHELQVQPHDHIA